MVKLAGFSGQKVIATLEKSFGFVIASQKGSHVKLKRVVNGMIITVIVPNHKELAPGTLRNVLRQAEIEPEEFLSKK